MAIRDECPEIALQGMTNMIPALTGYIDKTPRPLIGHLPVSGTYIIGALSGYGLMVACAVGELLAVQIAGSKLPKYADAFLPQRYQDTHYQNILSTWHVSGQL